MNDVRGPIKEDMKHLTLPKDSGFPFTQDIRRRENGLDFNQWRSTAPAGQKHNIFF
jgi:hypothetical protein